MESKFVTYTGLPEPFVAYGSVGKYGCTIRIALKESLAPHCYYKIILHCSQKGVVQVKFKHRYGEREKYCYCDKIRSRLSRKDLRQTENFFMSLIRLGLAK